MSLYPEQGPKSYERIEYIDTGVPQNLPGPTRSPRFSPERMVRIVIGIGVIAIGVLLIWYFSRLVIYLVSGSVIAYLTKPLVERIEGFGISKVPAILITFVGVLGIIAILVTSLVPFFAEQLTDITQQITEERVISWADAIETELRTYLPFIEEGNVRDGVSRISATLFHEQRFAQMVESIVDIFTDIFYAILVIPFVTFFFLRDASIIQKTALQMVPNKYFEVTVSVIEKIENTIGRYLRGLLLQSTFVALVAFICLSFTDINYALLIALFTGIANTIPYFGPFMGLTAGSMVAIAQTGDFSLIPGVFIAMGITQTADNLILQPVIFSKSSQTHPLIILFVVLIGAQLGGIVGMLIAIPLMTIIWVTLKHTLWSLRNYRILHSA